jgi:predicted lipid-binding transport protein (Tim44 family)
MVASPRAFAYLQDKAKRDVKSVSNFPVDLVLFGLIAGFLILRLRSILGRRTGYERPPAPSMERPIGLGPIIQGKAEPVPPMPEYVVPEPASPAGRVLKEMRLIDPNFDPMRFLQGAETAFRIIVKAFAAGDRAALRPLLTEETFSVFEAAISAREQAAQHQHTEIKAITRMVLEEAELSGTEAALTVRIVSDQINLTTDAAGQPVAGSEAVTEIVDLWTFRRNLRSPDPTWRLAATRTG